MKIFTLNLRTPLIAAMALLVPVAGLVFIKLAGAGTFADTF